MTFPKLTFFCELESEPLQTLFQNPEVIQDLSALNGTVSLGIRDLSAVRAEVVRRLNDAGIPVTAWLLLPKEQGYYFNIDNYPEAVFVTRISITGPSSIDCAGRVSVWISNRTSACS